MEEKKEGEKGVNPRASGVNDAQKEDDEFDKIIEREIGTVNCIDDAIPGARTELCGDAWAYDVFLGDTLLGTVYFADVHGNVFPYSEICMQVEEIKLKWLSAQGRRE
jgi:hypothetical protein